jgi:Flp pilus assembly protein TadG
MYRQLTNGSNISRRSRHERTGAQMRAPLRAGFRDRSGSAAVELAVLLPIILTLMLGIWEVGRMIQVTQIIDNAAREGARQASTGFYDATGVQTIVNNYMANAGLNTANSTVTVYNLTQNPTPAPNAPSDDPSAANQLDHLRVIVTLPFNNVKWIFLSQVTNVTTLSATEDWDSMIDKPLTVDSTMPIN